MDILTSLREKKLSDTYRKPDKGRTLKNVGQRTSGQMHKTEWGKEVFFHGSYRKNVAFLTIRY